VDLPNPAALDAARRLAITELWRRGDLEYLLHPAQKQIYRTVRGSKERRHFLCCSRRFGKSFALVAVAVEECLRRPNARVLYLAPWGHDAANIVRDIALTLLADCPQELKPEYNNQAREYTFPNGSIIRFRGVNGERAQFLRGGSAHLVVLDECGTMDNLKEVVDEVVTPMTLTTDGLVIMATTPSRTPAHPSKDYFDTALREGCAYEFPLPLNTNPDFGYDKKVRALKAMGEDPADIPLILAGKKRARTTEAKREYMCEWVTDSASAVVPEFDEATRATIVREHSRPPFFDAYTALDPGYVDRTGILFAYVDTREQKLIIEDEWLGLHSGTTDIAAAIRKKESELWGERAPYIRVSDIDKRLISDLLVEHGLAFAPALKHDAKGGIWLMRQMIRSHTIVIHPRCKHLIRQLETAVWNNKATDFADEHIPGDDQKIPAHFDLVSALRYLCRIVDWNHNPYPPGYFDPRWPGQRSFRNSEDENLRPASQTPMGRKLEKWRKRNDGWG
jgi:hypothetical protein